MAEVEVYQRAWDDFLEAYGKVAAQNRKLVDLVCDMAEFIESAPERFNAVGEENEDIPPLLTRYKEIMNLDG